MMVINNDSTLFFKHVRIVKTNVYSNLPLWYTTEVKIYLRLNTISWRENKNFGKYMFYLYKRSNGQNTFDLCMNNYA